MATLIQILLEGHNELTIQAYSCNIDKTKGKYIRRTFHLDELDELCRIDKISILEAIVVIQNNMGKALNKHTTANGKQVNSKGTT